MNTLAAAPLAGLLDSLFAEAEAAETAADSFFPDAEPGRLERGKTGYLDYYRRLRDLPLAVSRETGRLLYLLARSRGARAMVEFGTSFGISALHLAAALRDNGGGVLVTSEFEPSKAARAGKNLAAGGLIDLVDIREGDALRTLRTDLPEKVDLLFLDGAKDLYTEILDLVEGRLGPGALVIADDAGGSPDYLVRVRSPIGGYLSIPFGGDVELSLRLG
ncbi:MAG: class I SAM-dependent methyltransferase [Planctomycetota bacterium]|nr:class I SAM-dependent methyltransferase [Planctomycetota bacterium]